MKILLNCLPPADVNTPSISLSILKKFMLVNGVETQIKYWNFVLSLMSDYSDSEDSEIRILPFLSILNDRSADQTKNHRIVSLLQKMQPDFIAENPNYYSEFLQDEKNEILEIIQTEIKNIDFSEISLFGISAKYYQWIPGMIIAEEIKKHAPDVKIIVGGFGSLNSAQEAMALCSSFDFATWGEGEYPLLELAEQIKSETPNYSIVPRLIFKENNEPKQSETTKSRYLDFDNYIFPDYSDFFNTYPSHKDKEQINIPINTIRSCHWKKCKFCDFNSGYKLRLRSPECIVREIEHISNEYGITTFSFVDSDTFGNKDHFEKLLNLIIDLKYRYEEDYIFWSEIIPNPMFDANLMKKMAIAGFKTIFIGYDGLADSLLAKMDKSNSFSDNLFFVKHSLINGILPIVNVIKHLPDETEQDVQECINNLHFLRFYYNDSIVSFTHQFVDLVLSSMTKYYSKMSENEIAQYNIDDITYLMPDAFSKDNRKFHLFRFKSSVPSNAKEWEKLISIEEYYKDNKFSYKLLENDGVLYYTEYCNDTEIENIVFGETDYRNVLSSLEQKVISFDELLLNMNKVFVPISEERLKEVLSNLKQSYLIYYKAEFENIVSVV